MTKREREEQQLCIKSLRRHINPGDTVYTVLRHVSRSGMYRVFGVYVIQNGSLLRIAPNVSKALGMKYDTRHGGVGVGGYGMDGGFEVVYNLGRVLFDKEFVCLGKDCPSNDHSNGDRDYTPHLHTDRGYALRHAWI